MKTIFKLIFLSILIYSNTGMAQSEFTVPLSDPQKAGKLIASMHSGSIIVKGTSRKDVLIRYKTEDEMNKDKNKDGKNFNFNFDISANHSKGNEKSKEGLKKVSGGNIDLSATENDNVIKVSTSNMHGDLHLEIEVPSTMDLKLSTHNDGDLVISNVSGALELNNHNGGILATGIKGSVIANTFNEDIKVSFDEVKDGSPMSFTTFNGDVDVTFPSTIKSTMKFKTDQGDIYTGFDVDIKSTGPVKKEDAKSGVYKVVVSEWKKADLNGGGPEFTFKTYNGDIYIRKK